MRCWIRCIVRYLGGLVKARSMARLMVSTRTRLMKLSVIVEKEEEAVRGE